MPTMNVMYNLCVLLEWVLMEKSRIIHNIIMNLCLFRILRNRLITREFRTTRILLLVCCCHCLTMIPLLAVNVAKLDTSEPKYLNLILLGIYVVQYTVNFFVYGARYKEYRKAYIFFLREIWRKITCTRLRQTIELESSSRGTRQLE